MAALTQSGQRASRNLSDDLRNRLPNSMEMLGDRVVRRCGIQGLTFGVDCREAVEQQGGKLRIPAGRLWESTDVSVRGHHACEGATRWRREDVMSVTDCPISNKPAAIKGGALPVVGMAHAT